MVFGGHSNGQPEYIQRTDYYPFGLVMAQKNYTSFDELSADRAPFENKYLYNGKEWQNDEVGGVKLDWYDYEARFYDAQLARFHTLDPLSEKYSFQSPYAYAANNPILFIDWMGMEPKVKGPYSGRAYTRNNGTVVVYRITTGQRVAANVTKQAIYASSGWAGVGLSMAESFGALDGRGAAETLGGGAVKFGEDLSKVAADDAVVGVNRGMFAKSAKSLNVFGKVLSAYQIGRAIADDTPTQSEALHSATFNITEEFQNGNINIANSALMEFSNGENPESVESHMNAIYNTLEQNLSRFDLTTNKGVSEANKYLSNNIDQIIRQINQMLQDDENK